MGSEAVPRTYLKCVEHGRLNQDRDPFDTALHRLARISISREPDLDRDILMTRNPSAWAYARAGGTIVAATCSGNMLKQ